ncbi:MAG: CRISPR-associated protein Cas5 [Bacteroidota bacterium]
MKGIQVDISGNWAHFRKPETSNNPLSHDFITKTALIGLIGAVLGVEREAMKPLFPQLSEDLKYGVQIKNAVKKQSWGFTFRSVSEVFAKAPKQMEIIRDPNYSVMIGLENLRSKSIFEEFILALQKQQACFTPVLGLHNCPADLYLRLEGDLEYVSVGEFETLGFITTQHKPKIPLGKSFRMGFEKMPTFQNDDFWNLPDRYVQVVYPSEQNTLVANGPHYIFNHKSRWVLI